MLNNLKRPVFKLKGGSSFSLRLFSSTPVGNDDDSYFQSLFAKPDPIKYQMK